MTTPGGKKTTRLGILSKNVAAGVIGTSAALGCAPEENGIQHETVGKVTQALTLTDVPSFADPSAQEGVNFPSDNRLFFGSNRAGGMGGRDVYYTDYLGGTSFTTPQLVPHINTAGNETSFVIGSGYAYFDRDGNLMKCTASNNLPNNDCSPVDVEVGWGFPTHIDSNNLYTGSTDFLAIPHNNPYGFFQLTNLNSPANDWNLQPYDSDTKVLISRNTGTFIADLVGGMPNGSRQNEQNIGSFGGARKLGNHLFGSDINGIKWQQDYFATANPCEGAPTGNCTVPGQVAGTPCADGVWSCDSGVNTCNQTTFADSEIYPACSGDKNCNGTPDANEAICQPNDPCEGIPVGQSCSTGQPGECATSTWTCDQNGSVSCLPPNPQPRDCNSSLDNNCDGTPDNQEAACDTGSGGTGGSGNSGSGGSPDGGMGNVPSGGTGNNGGSGGSPEGGAGAGGSGGEGPVAFECPVTAEGEGCTLIGCENLQEGGAVAMNSTGNGECTFTLTENGEVTIVYTTTGEGFSSYQPYSFYIDHDEWDIDHIAGSNIVYEFESEFGGTVWGGTLGTHIHGERGMMTAGISGVRMEVSEGSAWMGVPPVENVGETPSQNICIELRTASAGESIEFTDQEINDILNPGGNGGAGGEGGSGGVGEVGGMGGNGGFAGMPEGDAGMGGEIVDDDEPEPATPDDDDTTEEPEPNVDDDDTTEEPEPMVGEGGNGGEEPEPMVDDDTTEPEAQVDDDSEEPVEGGDAGADKVSDGGADGCSCSTPGEGQNQTNGQVLALLAAVGLMAARRRNGFVGIEAK